jgi:hypothetical protein
MFRIVNNMGLALLACCQFNYRGHTISMSSIFQPSEVQTWPLNDPTTFTNHVSVEAAIDYINATQVVEKPKDTAHCRPAEDVELVPGTVIYVHNFNGTAVEEQIIIKDRFQPEKANPADGFICVRGIDHPISLGDRGMQGYRYDDRPARIYLSKQHAEDTLHLTKQWWDGRKR